MDKYVEICDILATRACQFLVNQATAKAKNSDKNYCKRALDCDHQIVRVDLCIKIITREHIARSQVIRLRTAIIQIHLNSRVRRQHLQPAKPNPLKGCVRQRVIGPVVMIPFSIKALVGFLFIIIIINFFVVVCVVVIVVLPVSFWTWDYCRVQQASTGTLAKKNIIENVVE